VANKTEYIKGLPTPPSRTGDDKKDLLSMENYIQLLHSALSRWTFNIPSATEGTGDIDGGNPASVYGGTEAVDGGVD
jgi:hypothetical protein